MKNLIFIFFIPFIFLGCGTTTTAPADINYTYGEQHTIGQKWVDGHWWFVRDDYREAGCRHCHGDDYGGSILSRIKTPITFRHRDGFVEYKINDEVSCYDCHNGPEGYLDMGPIDNGLDNNF